MLNATAVRFSFRSRSVCPSKEEAPPTNLATSLVIFDSQVADLPLLYNALLPGSIGHTIQPHQDSIDTITHLLTETGATKLAIVAHGQPGAIQIGNGKIDRATLETRSGLLQEWGLDSIELYSCEVGADAEFINRLGELTGAQISASTNKLGAGNWELDSGMALLEIDRLADYSSTLATFNGTTGVDSALAIGAGAYLTGFSDGNPLTNDVDFLTDGIGDLFNGNDGNDDVFAGNGDDIIFGDAGNDFLVGGDGNDRLFGGIGDDYLSGSSGNDQLTGGSGINTLSGGGGDDFINADYMLDTVDGGTGNDFLFIASQPVGQAYKVIFTGANSGNFQINGTDTGTFTGIEQLYFRGNNGNDTIDANLANLSVTTPGTAEGFGTFGLNINTLSGNDIVLGSAGKDSIDGGSGDDALYGQGGDDTIDGGYGFDTIFGGAGIDMLSGGGFNDQIFGGTENDIIKGDEGEDYLYGEDGDDNIKGGYGFDVIYGQAGNDTIYGEGVTFNLIVGNDTTVAPAPGVGINDTIFGGIGGDYIYGGIGDDVLLGEEGLDSIYGGDGNDFIYGGINRDFLYGEAGNDYIVGQDGDDNLSGGDGSDYLSGDAGDDEISGGNDNDFLYGNVGDDSIYGDAGNDFLDGGDGGDFLYGGDGIDTIFGVEGNDQIYGGAAEDYLYGGIGNDTIRGESGTDFLIGGTGSDILTGGADSDKFLYFAMTDAGDTITDFDVSATGDKLNLSALFASISVASGAVNTNYLKFIPVGVGGINTAVQVDQDGIGAASFVTIATLNSVTAAQLSFGVGGNVIV
jgi:Ca2+-binding RTX toxin-like protein